jgi:hypothetical protein
MVNAAWVGWALAVAAVAGAFVTHGWRGALMALSVVAFWLVLQFSRSLRILRQAAGRPVGEVPNAVMLHARVHPGMRLPDILPIARSLGRRAEDDPETFTWTDAGGDAVRIEFRQGRVFAWHLQRAAPPAAPKIDGYPDRI